jgi:hypothetical protein
MIMALIIVCQLSACHEIPAQVRKDLCDQEWSGNLSGAGRTITQVVTIRCRHD